MAGKAPIGPIPQTDPRAGYLAYQPTIDRAISRVLEGGSYILGKEVESFEAAFADFVGVAHAIGCASGTDAIELALRACKIGSGDRVFTVSCPCQWPAFDRGLRAKPRSALPWSTDRIIRRRRVL